MKALILFLLLAVACQFGWAHDSFAPWDADVAVGDGLLHPQGSVSHAAAFPSAGYPTGDAEPGIYDSFTGAAYLLIRVFQLWISPLDGPNCRFRPTCSAYGMAAVRKHGAFFGGVLAGDRILRCNPFSKPGDDPVPDTLFDR
ncbi:MAG: membrane protein insertion efficiency factor YidD [Spirochaetes bacterium]|nr:membrane protein insertion efficiency factor YidD [Spirochaetota bacterium]